MTDQRQDDPPGPARHDVPRAIVDEQLSAWLDSELPAMEMELLVARFGRSADGEGLELEARRRTIARYGLIGEIVRGGSALHPAGMDLACRVREALGQGPDAVETLPVDSAAVAGRPREAARRRTVGRLPVGLAASLLAGVGMLGGFVAVQTLDDPAAPAAPGVVAAPGIAAVAQSPRAAAGLSPDRLTNYLVYHGEYSGALATRVSDSHVVAARGTPSGGLALDAATAVDAGR